MVDFSCTRVVEFERHDAYTEASCLRRSLENAERKEKKVEKMLRMQKRTCD